jgi:ATP-binding cassette subfamily B (MDR/TAP) protein 1
VAVLRQDVGSFDTDARTGNFIHYLATFLAGLVVGFVSAWRLELLSITVIPGIAFAGELYAYTLTGLTSKSRNSSVNAGIIAERSLLLLGMRP